MSPRDLGREIATALADEDQKGALFKATSAVNRSRREALGELEGESVARARARAVKERSVAELPELLDRLEAAVAERGGKVHRAPDAEQACRIVCDLARERGVQTAVKSKSMTTEEIHLNAALEEAGIVVRETDLGEYIVQLSNDRPSHIIAPIIHKTVEDVRDAFRQGLGLEAVPETPAELTQLARRLLRRQFVEADLGITGANFLLADTGTLVVVENEGNARLTTQLPPVHVAVVGIEKVIPGVGDLAPFLQLLPRSATGQLQTSYLSFISGPGWRGSPLARGREREFHLVLLDNGRSAMRDDPLLREALYCIRCGACMTVCPPYQVVGGHVYGGPTYPSGIGNAWEAGVSGLETAASFNDLCTTCSRCHDVCPIDIDIPWMNAVLRDRIARSGRPRRQLLESIVARPLLPDAEDRGVGLAARFFANPERVYRLTRRGGVVARWLAGLGVVRALLERLVGLDAERPLPVPDAVTLAHWHRRRGGIVVESPVGASSIASAETGVGRPEGATGAPGDPSAAPSTAVALYVDCHTNHAETTVGRAAVRSLEKLGFTVILVTGRCCGRAALSQGMIGTAEAQARGLQAVLAPLARAGHPIMGVEPSCFAAVVDDHDKLLADGSTRGTEAACQDLAAFLAAEVRRREGLDPPGPGWRSTDPLRAVVHGHCQQKTMGWLRDTLELLQAIPGVEALATSSECCGMAGSFGYKKEFGGISRELGRRLVVELGECGRGLGPGAPTAGTGDAGPISTGDRATDAGDDREIPVEVFACGTSCRAQLAQVGDIAARHPLELLEERLD